ncbi:hypothetical protein K435DRAFT_792810 [Dendrothele bispora CBS 962.96]|uniref:Uncharacterized protein n=1 Tax=Dendrothele bispora (strain CBS 962.96) TaxID=1314807 RepID=A0A4S8MHI7_DENBC|nr:hypothetical protein K435DRAFT_792810 [Dendrothele bispora CBS 962.96]
MLSTRSEADPTVLKWNNIQKTSQICHRTRVTGTIVKMSTETIDFDLKPKITVTLVFGPNEKWIQYTPDILILAKHILSSGFKPSPFAAILLVKGTARVHKYLKSPRRLHAECALGKALEHRKLTVVNYKGFLIVNEIGYVSNSANASSHINSYLLLAATPSAFHTMFSSWNPRQVRFQPTPFDTSSPSPSTRETYEFTATSGSDSVLPAAEHDMTTTIPHHPLATSSTSRVIYSSSDFVLASIEEKQSIVKFLVSSLPLSELRKSITLHYGISSQHSGGRKKTLQELRNDLGSHRCCGSCLIRRQHADGAGLINLPTLSEIDFYPCAKLLKLRNAKPASFSLTGRKRKNPDDKSAEMNKKQRIGHVPLDSDHQSAATEESDWLEILSWDEKQDIMQECYNAGNNTSIASGKPPRDNTK